MDSVDPDWLIHECPECGHVVAYPKLGARVSEEMITWAELLDEEEER